MFDDLRSPMPLPLLLLVSGQLAFATYFADVAERCSGAAPETDVSSSLLDAMGRADVDLYREANAALEAAAMWADESLERGLLVKDKGQQWRLARHPIMFAYEYGMQLTYGDLFPWLNLAVALAKRGAPVVVHYEYVWPSAFDVLSKLLGKPNALEVPPSLKPVFDGPLFTPRDNADYFMWWTRANESDKQGLVLLLPERLPAGRKVLRSFVATDILDTQAPVLWVTPGFGHPHEQLCFSGKCRFAPRPTYKIPFVDVMPDRFTASLCTGDTNTYPGEMLFNVRSKLLFGGPARPLGVGAATGMPRPLGMIKSQGPSGSLPPEMAAWFQSLSHSNAAKTVVCFALGSFVEDTAKYKGILRELVAFPEVRLLLQAYPESPRPDWWPSPMKHFVQEGFMPNDAVFPHCDVVVHAGGAGTVTEVARLGKAQIIVSHFTGNDKLNNAKELGEFVLAVRQCRKTDLAALLDVADETSCDMLTAAAIRAAPVLEKEAARKRQQLLEDEMGPVKQRESNALRTVSDELYRVWERAHHIGKAGVPILIFRSASERIATAELVAFALALASRTNAEIAFVGVTQSQWDSEILRHSIRVPTNIRSFVNTSTAMRGLGSTNPLSTYSKIVVLACEPYAKSYGDLDLPYALNVIFNSDCNELWEQSDRVAWRTITLPDTIPTEDSEDEDLEDETERQKMKRLKRSQFSTRLWNFAWHAATFIWDGKPIEEFRSDYEGRYF